MGANLAEMLERHGLPMGPDAFMRLLARALAARPPLHYGPSGLADYMAMMECGLSVLEAADRLSVGLSRIRGRLREHSLYGFKVDRAWLLPAFQFAGRRSLPGLREVVPQIDPRAHPISVHYFFVRPRPELRLPGANQELSPRDWLLLGQSQNLVSNLTGTLLHA